MTDIMKASIAYDNIINNFYLWQRHGVGDRKSKVDLFNAATVLAELNLPNPFKEQITKMNAAKRPGEGLHVTGVDERMEEKKNDIL